MKNFFTASTQITKIRLTSAIFAVTFLATSLLSPFAALAQPSSTPSAGSVDPTLAQISQLETKDQVATLLQLHSPINSSATGTEAGQREAWFTNATPATVSYQKSASAPTYIFPATALVEYLNTDGNGSQHYVWIFDLPARDGKTLGFYIDSIKRAEDDVGLFFAPGDPASDKTVAQHISDYKIASVNHDQSYFGSYNPPLLDDGSTADQATASAQKIGIAAIYQSKNGAIDQLAIGVTGALPDPLKAAFAAVNTELNGILQGLIQNYGQVIQPLLSSQYLNFFGTSGQGCQTNDAQSQSACKIHDVWSAVRDTVNILFILVLIAIAFFNVLHIQVEYYAIRALLPRFIVSVILINFSLIFAQIIIDFSNVLTNSIFPNFNNLAILHGTFAGGAAITGLAAFPFFDTFILLTIAIAVLALVVVLFARIAFLWFLVAIAPIPYLLGVLPLTRSLSGWWWKNFIAFVFIAPLMAIVLFIATQISAVNFGTDQTAQLIQTGLVIALLFVATVIPGVLGGRILGLISGHLNARTATLRKNALSRSLGSQMLSQSAKHKDDRAAIQGAKGLDLLGDFTGGVLGTQGERKRLEGGLVKKRMDEDKHLNFQELEWQVMHGKSDVDRRSALLTLLESDQIGIPGSKLGANHIEFLTNARQYVTNDGMADAFKAAAKKNFSYFNDPVITRLRKDLAAKGVLAPPIYGADDAVQQLAIRLNAEKVGDLSKGWFENTRGTLAAANVSLSLVALQQMSSRNLNEVMPENARNLLVDMKARFLQEQSARGMELRMAEQAFATAVANQTRGFGLDEAFYRQLAATGFTSWSSITQKNIIEHMLPHVSSMGSEPYFGRPRNYFRNS